jgi:hypothetical protein
MKKKLKYQTGNRVKQTPFQQYVADHPASLYDDSKSSAVDTLTSTNPDPRFLNGKFYPKSDQLDDKSMYEKLDSREEKDIDQAIDLELAYQNTFKFKKGLLALPYNMSYMPDSIADTMRGKRAIPQYNPLGKKMGGRIKYGNGNTVTDPSLMSQGMGAISGMAGGPSAISMLPVATNVALGIAGEKAQNSVGGQAAQAAANWGSTLAPLGPEAAIAGAAIAGGVTAISAAKEKKNQGIAIEDQKAQARANRAMEKQLTDTKIGTNQYNPSYGSGMEKGGSILQTTGEMFKKIGHFASGIIHSKKNGVDETEASIPEGAFVIPAKYRNKAIKDGILANRSISPNQGGVDIMISGGKVNNPHREGVIMPGKVKQLMAMGVDLNKYAPDAQHSLYDIAGTKQNVKKGGSILNYVKGGPNGRVVTPQQDLKSLIGKSTSSVPSEAEMDRRMPNRNKGINDRVGIQYGIDGKTSEGFDTYNGRSAYDIETANDDEWYKMQPRGSEERKIIKANRKIAKENPAYWRTQQQMQGSSMPDYDESQQEPSLWSKASNWAENAVSNVGNRIGGGSSDYEPGSEEDLMNKQYKRANLIDSLQMMNNLNQQNKNRKSTARQLKPYEPITYSDVPLDIEAQKANLQNTLTRQRATSMSDARKQGLTPNMLAAIHANEMDIASTEGARINDVRQQYDINKVNQQNEVRAVNQQGRMQTDLYNTQFNIDHDTMKGKAQSELQGAMFTGAKDINARMNAKEDYDKQVFDSDYAGKTSLATMGGLKSFTSDDYRTNKRDYDRAFKNIAMYYNLNPKQFNEKMLPLIKGKSAMEAADILQENFEAE